MPSSSDLPGRTSAFVLVSYQPDEPSGLARAAAAAVARLRDLGHRAINHHRRPATPGRLGHHRADPAARHLPRDDRPSAMRSAQAAAPSPPRKPRSWTPARSERSSMPDRSPCSAASVSHPARPVLAVDDIASLADLAASRSARARARPGTPDLRPAGHRQPRLRPPPRSDRQARDFQPA